MSFIGHGLPKLPMDASYFLRGYKTGQAVPPIRFFDFASARFPTFYQGYTKQVAGKSKTMCKQSMKAGVPSYAYKLQFLKKSTTINTTKKFNKLRILKWGAALCVALGIAYYAATYYSSKAQCRGGNQEANFLYDWTVGWFKKRSPANCSGALGYCTCGLHCQSPINIQEATTHQVDLPDITFNYNPARSVIQHLGHTVQVAQISENALSTNNHIKVDGQTYDFKQLHFHTPSEHVINNKRFDLEAHFVHKDTQGNIAVVGAVIAEGPQDNVAYKTLIDSLPIKPSESVRLPEPLNLDTLLPQDRRTFRYAGSLTTSPFSTGVKWMLAREPLTFSKQQINAMRSVLEENARELQPLGDRTVVFDTTIDA